MSKLNLVSVLHQTMGVSLNELGHGLGQRSPGCRVDIKELEVWADSAEPVADIPAWTHRAAAVWVIEYWMNERDACRAEGLLKVDEKYTRLLKDFSMGEIIAMRSSVVESSLAEAEPASD